LLSGSDLVKFAKHQPVAAENEIVITQARTIVEETKPVVEVSGKLNDHENTEPKNIPVQS
jgi:hypothetical protein